MAIVDPWLPAPVDGVVSLNRPCAPTRVTRREQSSPGIAATYTEFPNLTWTSIPRKVGTDPGACRLVYRLGTGDPADPQNFEECLSDQIARAHTIEPNDRVVIWATRPDGGEEAIFDGHALGFDGTLSPTSEGVGILCVGAAYRLWDEPIRGSTWRDGADPLAGPDVETEIEPHFNPKGRGNCGPADPETWANRNIEGDRRFPTFLDPDNTHDGDAAPTQWTLAKAARYLIFRHLKGDDVQPPDGSILDDVLQARLPIEGQAFDYADEATFERADIVLADKPIASKDWPGTLHQLIADKGFEQAFDLETDDSEPGAPQPVNSLRVFIPQEQEVKPLWLQPRGSSLDLALTNLGWATIGRDLAQVVNAWHVEGALERVEASFILACGFPTEAADGATIGALAAFDLSAPGFGDVRDKYRLFVFDEAGEGHHAPGSALKLSMPPSLDAALGAPEGEGEDAVPRYVNRRRKPNGELITRDGAGITLKARLDISTDYGGDYPAVWEAGPASAGTWQPVNHGWELLKDRIGVRVTAKNPNEWSIGRSGDTTHPFKDGMVKAVECLTRNTGPNKKFWLRLTCVIEADRRVRGSATRPINSVVTRPITRVVEAHDRYRKERVLGRSVYRDEEDEDLVTRDDTDAATAEATSIQLATMNGIMGGTATIPRLTTHYRVGDRISHIQGRALGFRADKDGPDAAPIYPVVTAVTFRNDPRAGQFTDLELSDANASRHTYLRQLRRRPDARNG